MSGRKECSVCGREVEDRYTQWWNRDAGYGICARCVPWIRKHEGDEALRRNYGEPGIHYCNNEEQEKTK